MISFVEQKFAEVFRATVVLSFLISSKTKLETRVSIK